MSNKGKHLSEVEQEILESYEKGEWQSELSTQRIADLSSYARATLVKDKKVSIRISSVDLHAIQTRAIQEGIPYQTLITSIIHKYVTGQFDS